MNKRIFWLLAIVICLGFAIWGLGFGLGGCSSTLQEATGSTTTTTSTAMSTTTTLALTWSGIKQFRDDIGDIFSIDNSDNIYTASMDTLTKLDPAGNRIWTKYFTGEVGDGAAIMDGSGNIYTTGGTDIGLDGNTNAGGSDFIISKYDKNGNKLWLKQFGTSADDSATGVAVDSTGNNIYVCGVTYGGLDGNTNLGSSDFFLMKLDSDGNKKWTKQFGTSSIDEANNMGIDSHNNIYIVGHVLLAGLDGNPVIGVMDAFLAKYDSDGNRIWTKQFGSTDFDIATNLAFDSNDNIYVAGHTFGALEGNSSNGGLDSYLAKFEPISGEAQWLKQYGTSGADRYGCLVVDSSGDIYVCGDTVPGQTGAIKTGGSSEATLTKTDPAGNILWSKQIGGDNSHNGDGTVVFDSKHYVFFCGNTDGILDGNTAAGSGGFFIIKYSPAGVMQ